MVTIVPCTITWYLKAGVYTAVKWRTAGITRGTTHAAVISSKERVRKNDTFSVIPEKIT